MTNQNCRIIVDRTFPTAPVPIRINPKAAVCVVVDKVALEEIRFETEYKDSQRQDPFSAIFAALAPNLKSILLDTRVTGLAKSTNSHDPFAMMVGSSQETGDFDAQVQSLRELLKWIEREQRDVRDSGDRLRALAVNARDQTSQIRKATRANYESRYRDAICATAAAGADVARLLDEGHLSCSAPEAPIVSLRLPEQGLKEAAERLAILRETLTAISMGAAAQREELTGPRPNPPEPEKDRLAKLEELVKVERAIATATANLANLRQQLLALDENQRQLQVFATDLANTRTGLAQFMAAVPAPGKDVWQASALIRPSNDQQNIRSLGVDRTVNVKLSSEDKVTKEKQPLTTVGLQWGTLRWELSGGVLFSNLKSRSFQTSPIIENGVVRRDPPGTGSTVSQIVETTSRPVVVPAVLIHYRIGETGATRRHAFLATGAIGVNPSTTSADFGAGLSYAWRSFILSPLLHVTRDVRLTNGLYVNQVLGTSAPQPSTEKYWVLKGAIAISYRIPIP